MGDTQNGEGAETGDDPYARPMTVQEQIESAEEWFKYFEQERNAERPVVDSFNEAWDYLSTLYEYNGKCVVERGASSANVANSPLAALFYHVDRGFYPPPELLFALHDAWGRYLYGNCTLEEAFLGPPKPKAGNYAKRQRTLMNKMRKAFEMTKLLRKGMTRMQAAERIAEEFGGDPETIVRTIPPFKTVRRPEK